MTSRSSRRQASGAVPFWAAQGVRAASYILPRGGVRDRYRQEFLAELHALTPRAQTTYTWSVLMHAPALRAATAGEQPPVAKEATMNLKPMMCRLHMHHVWHTYSTEDGSRYRRCMRCGKDHPRPGGNGLLPPVI